MYVRKKERKKETGNAGDHGQVRSTPLRTGRTKVRN